MNILLLTTLMVLGVATLPWMLPFALLGAEVTFLVAAARMPLLKQYFDREEAEIQQERALAARQQLLGEMSDEHRTELEHLEILVESMRIWDGASILEDHLRLRRLTARYAELAVAYREAKRRLSLTDCEAVEGQLASMERALAQYSQVQQAQNEQQSTNGKPAKLRKVHERRRRIARKRLACYQENLTHLELMRRELSAIGEYIRLLHEQSLAGFSAIGAVSMSAAGNEEELDEFMSDLDELQQGMDEVTESLDDGDTPPRVPQLLVGSTTEV